MLSRQDICLASLDGTFLFGGHFPDLVASKRCLDPNGGVIFPESLHVDEALSLYKTFHRCLNHHEALSFPPEVLTALESAVYSLDIDNKVMLCVCKNKICIPTLVRINFEKVVDDQA